MILTRRKALTAAPALLLASSANAQLMMMTGAGLGTVASAGSLLLDTLSVPAIAAFSTRKLRTAYAGNAIKVRTSSGGGLTDIGFTGNDLNTTALHAAIGANTGSVNTCYDQSISVTNATQSTAGNQPLVVVSGTDQTLNGHVGINFDAAIQPSTLSYTPGLTTQPITVAVCIAENATPSNHYHDNGSVLRVLLGIVAPAYAMFAGGAPATAGTISTNGTCHSLIGIFNSAGGGAASQMIFDGSTIITGNTTIGAGAFDGVTAATIGNNGVKGFIAEILVFAAALGSTDLATIRSSWQAYWGAA